MNIATNVLAFSPKAPACSDCPRRPSCAWRNLHASAESAGAPDITVRLFHRGDAIFHAGDSLDGLYLLRSGAAKTTIGSEGGDEQIIGFHVAGEMLGLDAIADGTFVSTATVLDTSSVCVLPYEAYRKAMRNSPCVEQVMLAMMSNSIRRYEQNLLMLGRLNAEQRMAAFLVDLLDASRSRGCSATSLSLPMSRADIAAYLSLAAETVSRVLTRLQSSGVLSIDRNNIEVLDVDRLQEAAGRTRTCTVRAALGTLH